MYDYRPYDRMSNPTLLADRYTALHAQAIALVDAIRAKLEDLPAPDSPGLNWGHSGDLALLVQKLRESAGEE